MWRLSLRRPEIDPADDAAELVADYVAAEDALREFTDRNFGRMCAICARWTLFAAQVNAAADENETVDGGRWTAEDPPAVRRPPSALSAAERSAVSWRLQSWVTNCCNANHALESMSENSLAGIVASREAGREWWRKVKRAATAPCAALTETGCALQRGRPELCNRYFCEAVRDYLWTIGGERNGPHLAAHLDDLQKRWAALYLAYQRAILAARQAPDGGRQPALSAAEGAAGGGDDGGRATADAGLGEPDRRTTTLAPRPTPHAAQGTQNQPSGTERLTNVRYRRRQRVRAAARWQEFFTVLRRFDSDVAQHARPVTPEEMTDRFFKVNGERDLYVPFFERELDAIDGRIRSHSP